MPSKLIDPAALPTMSFDWGLIKPLVANENTDGPELSLMHVVLLPGEGHERHNHPDSDEILYILSGRGEQMVDDSDTFAVGPGQAVFIPKGAFHSTVNVGLGAARPACDLRAGGRRGGAQGRCPTTARSARARRRRLVRG